MTDKETIQRLSDYCDGLRRAIEVYVVEEKMSQKKLIDALTSWNVPTKQLIEKETK